MPGQGYPAIFTAAFSAGAGASAGSIGYGEEVSPIVFNTCTQEYEEVIVTEEVYRTYCRTRWNIKDNDQSFFDHEIQTSGMIGSQDGAYENFREFIDAINTPEHIILEQIKKEALYQAISALPAADQALVQGLFFKGQSELDYAREIGVSQPAVHKRKVRILKSLKKLLENRNSHRPNISSVISGYKQPSKSAQSIEITGFIEKSRPPEIIFFYTLLPLTA